MNAGSCASAETAWHGAHIRHFFERGEVTEQELRTLHGCHELALGRRQLAVEDESS